MAEQTRFLDEIYHIDFDVNTPTVRHVKHRLMKYLFQFHKLFEARNFTTYEQNYYTQWMLDAANKRILELAPVTIQEFKQRQKMKDWLEGRIADEYEGVYVWECND